MGIAVVVGALVIGVVLSMNETIYRTGERAEINQEVLMMSEWFSTELQSVGGGMLTPGMSAFVENDYNGDDTDRLTTVSFDNSLPICGLISQPTSSTYQLSHDENGVCCMDASINGRQVVLISTGSDAWRSLRVLSLNDTAFACEVTFDSGSAAPVGSSIQVSGLAASLDVYPTAANIDDAFLQGAMMVVDVKRYTVDPVAQELIMEQDADPLDGAFETEVMADRFFDLQLAMGYDPSPADGKIDDNQDQTDEWLYNHRNDAMGFGGLSNAAPTNLRGLQLAFILGWPAINVPNAPQVFVMDGPTLSESDFHLQEQTIRIHMRNQLAFQ